MSMIFHCPILRLSKGSGLWRLRKQNVNLNFQLPVMTPPFFCCKSGIIKIYSSSEDLSAYKIS
jgi:hypothetical protein